jgi:hypothetical protein
MLRCCLARFVATMPTITTDLAGGSSATLAMAAFNISCLARQIWSARRCWAASLIWLVPSTWNRRAGQSHDALLAALEGLHNRIEDAWPELRNLPPMITARAAIAAVKGADQ